MKKNIIVIATVSALIWAYGYLNSQNAATNNKNDVSFSILGNKVICPVMKKPFFITDKSPKAEYKGKVYFFCCGGCVEKFNKEPDKYLSDKGMNKQHNCDDCVGKDSKSGTKHDCPMKGMAEMKHDSPDKK